jgi:hypothetical protein
MTVKRFSLLVLVAFFLWGVWWFLSRSWDRARDEAEASRAQLYLTQIDERQSEFARNNPTRRFACQLDDLLRAGLRPPTEGKYKFELYCHQGEKPTETDYLVAAYPTDKRVKGVWGFWVLCSDQTGEVWGSLSREGMRDSLSESEKAGLYDFELICRRGHHASRR